MLLHDLFDYRATTRGHLTFAECGAEAITYDEARRRTNRFANGVVRAGLRSGDRLVYAGVNSVDHALLYFALSKVGVVAVPVNPRLTAPERAFIVEDSGAKAVIDETTSLDMWLADAPDTEPPYRAEPDDVLYQMYTSGTTGRPKGVLLTHRSVLANCTQVSAGLSYAIEPGDRWLIVAPLFHAAAVITAFNCVFGGGCLVIHQGFDPAAVVTALDEDRIALTTLVPAMIQACLAVPGADERRYPALRAMAYGGSTITEHVLRQAIGVFGCDFYQGFGQTEASAGITYLTELDHRRALEDRPELLASCGRALPGTEVRVVDEAGRPLGPGEVGHVVARGPQLMRGYWNRAEDTAAALRDGWLWTGDAGSLDTEGYLTIRDRLKDMVVTGGENVYPREVEQILATHPAIADVAVIGVPDPVWGEAVHAVVVARDGAAFEVEALRDHCRDRLAGFKLPRSMELVESLPRNASGKVLKNELRREHESTAARGAS